MEQRKWRDFDLFIRTDRALAFRTLSRLTGAAVLLFSLAGCQVIKDADVNEQPIDTSTSGLDSLCTFEQRETCTSVDFIDDDTFIVPEGVSQLYIQAWGGGGGAGQTNALTTEDVGRTPDTSDGGVGGDGAYMSLTLSVEPGQKYIIQIGRGTGTHGGGGCRTGGEGGWASRLVDSNAADIGPGGGGGGGGATCVSLDQDEAQPVLISGGGGGGGGGGYSEIYKTPNSGGGGGGMAHLGVQPADVSESWVTGDGGKGVSSEINLGLLLRCESGQYFYKGAGGFSGANGGLGRPAGSYISEGSVSQAGSNGVPFAESSAANTSSGGEGGSVRPASLLGGGGGGGGGAGYIGGGGGGGGGSCVNSEQSEAQIAGGAGGGLGSSFPREPTEDNRVECGQNCGIGGRADRPKGQDGGVTIWY